MTRTRKVHWQISRSRAALNRPRLPSAEAETAPPRTGVCTDVLIVQTLAIPVKPREPEISHYEIFVAPDGGLDAPRQKFLTRSRDLFDQAVDLEAKQVRVTCAWSRRVRTTGVVCQMLDSFQEGV